MRITGGKYRGQKLVSPQNNRIRPTADRVRESVFNILEHKSEFSFEDKHVLDLFCGVGTLGIEALSRGASKALFVDASPASLTLCKTNIEKIKQTQHCDFIRAKAHQTSVKPEFLPIDIVFADPPYHKNLSEPALLHIIERQYLSSAAYFIVEMSKQSPENLHHPNVTQIDERTYGDTIVRFYHFQST